MRRSFGITLLFVFLDFSTAAISWALFYYFRKSYVENMPLELSEQFYAGVLIIPFFWIALYTLFGTYFDTWRLYLMRVLSMTFKSVFIGTIIIFFCSHTWWWNQQLQLVLYANWRYILYSPFPNADPAFIAHILHCKTSTQPICRLQHLAHRRKLKSCWHI